MGYTLVAVLLRDPVEHIRTPVIVKVHVDIRHGDTVGVEEALEEEVIANGVDVGDAETVGYGRSCGRSTARAYEDAHITGGSDEVLYDEEVPREAHAGDDAQLEVDTLTYLLGDTLFAVLAAGTLVGQMTEVFVGIGELLGDREVRHERIILNAVELDLVADLLCGGEYLG